MVETLLEDVREHIAESSKHIGQEKSAVQDACEVLIRKSKHAVKAGRGAAEDFVGQSEHTVKKYPKSAVATGILTGIILGFCLGWLLVSRD